MICTRKYPFCLGGTVPPASEWPKLGGAKQGDQGPCWSHQQPPVFAFFGKSSHDFFNILLSAFLCKPDSSLSSSMIWINPKRIHEQMPISIIVSFSVGSTHSTPIDCTHLKVFWCMGSPGIFSGVEGKTRRTLLWFDLELHLRSAQPHPIHPRRVQRLPPTVFRPN